MTKWADILTSPVSNDFSGQGTDCYWPGVGKRKTNVYVNPTIWKPENL